MIRAIQQKSDGKLGYLLNDAGHIYDMSEANWNALLAQSSVLMEQYISGKLILVATYNCDFDFSYGGSTITAFTPRNLIFEDSKGVHFYVDGQNSPKTYTNAQGLEVDISNIVTSRLRSWRKAKGVLPTQRFNLAWNENVTFTAP